MSRQVLSSPSFQRLTSALKQSKKTCTAVEQCCGGLISTSIMAQPGSSAVYYGGSIAYNTRKAKPLLLNNDQLHASLLSSSTSTSSSSEKEAEAYIHSKLHWTAQTSVAFCEALNTDYCIAEGGAAGPTFGHGLQSGFAALAVAGRDENGTVKVLGQKVIHSKETNRETNMRFFADAAADFCTEFVLEQNKNEVSVEEEKMESSSNSNSNSSSTTINEPAVACALMLDRATHLRSDKDALEALKPQAKYIVLKGANQVLVKSATEPALLSYKQVSSLEGTRTFLGLLSNQDKTPVFGIDLMLLQEKDATRLLVDNSHDTSCSFVDTRTSAPLFAPLENELVLHATALAQWQRRSSFCTACGGAAELVDGGTSRRCTSCQSQSWPRQDPSIIVAVSSRDGQRVLLARSPRHPPKVYTVLAGFVEAGETLEAAVARETFEETGIAIDQGSVQYVGSQPWPFPQSCMIGFTAVANDKQQDLVVDTNELVNAAWFDKSQVQAAAAVPGATMQHNVAEAALQADPSLSLLIPPKGVMARTLLDTWLAKS